MNIQQAAQGFLDLSKDMSRTDLRAALQTLPKEVQTAFWALRKASFFTPENAKLENRTEHLSPSGRYKLVITPFKTGSGTWDYTQGLVYTIGSDTPIAEVQRNYHHFPFTFIEGHPKGDFLVCGEDYQGQTVIELGTGTRWSHVSRFCWVRNEYLPAMQAIFVDGCFWGASYEFRFFDFSDPMTGWPEIVACDANEDPVSTNSDERLPEVSADGKTIKVFQTEDDQLASFTIYRREGLRLLPIESWVSEKEQRRRRQEEDEDEEDAS